MLDGIDAENNPVNLYDIMGLRVNNNTGVTIYIKPEKAGTALPINPGGHDDQAVDGVTVPSSSGGQRVFKVFTGCDSVVDVYMDRVTLKGPDSGGYFLERSPDSGWDALFDSVTPPQPPDMPAP